MTWLSAQEVAMLDAIYLRGERAVQQLRAAAPVGRFLHAVKVPPRLTESIAALACEQLFGEGAIVLDDRRGHDLRVRTRHGRTLNVAVKGTGRGDWASITASDRRADTLVWVDYSERLAYEWRPVILRKIATGCLDEVGDRAFLRRLAGTCIEHRFLPPNR